MKRSYGGDSDDDAERDRERSERSRKRGRMVDEESGMVRLRGLPYHTTESELKEFFSSVDLVPTSIYFAVNVAGKDIGVAFVVFPKKEDVDVALTKDKGLIQTRYIEIFEAFPGDLARYKTRKCGEESKDTENLAKLTLRVRGLPFGARDQDVADFFEEETTIEIEDIRILLNSSGRSSGEALVTFHSEDDVEKAMKKDRGHIGSRYVELFPCTATEIMARTSSTPAPRHPPMGRNYGYGRGNSGSRGGFRSQGGYAPQAQGGYGHGHGSQGQGGYGHGPGSQGGYGHGHGSQGQGGYGHGPQGGFGPQVSPYGGNGYGMRNQWDGVPVYGGGFESQGYAGDFFPPSSVGVTRCSSQWMGKGNNPPTGPSPSTLRMRGLPYDVTYDEIDDYFEGISDYLPNSVTFGYNVAGRLSGEAYVQFVSPRSVALVLNELAGKKIGKRYIELFRT